MDERSSPLPPPGAPPPPWPPSGSGAPGPQGLPFPPPQGYPPQQGWGATAPPRGWTRAESRRATGPLVIPLVAAALTILGALLPWATIQTVFGSVSVSGVDDGRDGTLTVFLGLILGVVALVALVRRSRGVAVGVTAIVIGVLVGLIGVIDVVDVSRVADDVNAEGFARASVGVGLWLTCLSGVLAVVGGIVSLATRPPRP